MTVMYALTVRALQQQLREQRRMTVTNSARPRSTGQCTMEHYEYNRFPERIDSNRFEKPGHFDTVVVL